MGGCEQSSGGKGRILRYEVCGSMWFSGGGRLNWQVAKATYEVHSSARSSDGGGLAVLLV